ncbi:hypothetical protein GGI03_006908 [Coemansia sp. RSA 2337]|nr:hypothetical protein GGI08_006797 [Coemansia sp. S2]KAJ2338209.1 hypothetical protein GGH92_007276 [Coemansia sp. RSA 2673]KAJ2451142.1 hypothetical protein GGI03_006908 [Coemansia sp. RSA 2337]
MTPGTIANARFMEYLANFKTGVSSETHYIGKVTGSPGALRAADETPNYTGDIEEGNSIIIVPKADVAKENSKILTAIITERPLHHLGEESLYMQESEGSKIVEAECYDIDIGVEDFPQEEMEDFVLN